MTRTSQPLRHRHFLQFSALFKKELRKMKPKEREKFRKHHAEVLHLLKQHNKEN